MKCEGGVSARQRFVEMGCMVVPRLQPDGDGTSSLPWGPDEITKRVATFDRQPVCRPARIMINQDAIFRKLNGESVESLPYPPRDLDRSMAGLPNMRDARALVNQEAIWLKLQSVVKPS